ncbi:interleukin-33 isoform X2 [Antechinus flavipes]|uniref:interleukin-33 isoform X2 n=1 Tax=Antechinus flavipes TaxID=38775 RepID=UPI0022356621|nr:interleukin-33 isoform X2 [Antechinus flavipes]
MKHLNGKKKNKTNKTMKKTSQKQGFSNSGKDYQIVYKHSRPKCIVEKETSIIRYETRHSQAKNIQSPNNQNTLNSFPSGFSNSGQGYQIYYMILRSRCIVKKKPSTIRHGKRRSQLKNIVSTTEKHSLKNFSSRISYSGESIMRNKAAPARYEVKSFSQEIPLATPFSAENSHNSYPPVEFKYTQQFTGLNTSKNKAVSFFFDNGDFDIFVEDLLEKEKRDLLLIDFFRDINSKEEPPLVVLRPQFSNINLQVHATDENNLELHKCENQNSAQEKRFFKMHPEGGEWVSFECYCFQGFYIGVKENSLGLIKKKEDDKAFIFQLISN